MRSILRALSYRPRLHWLSWTAMLLAGVVLVLITVPGEYANPFLSEDGTPWEQQRREMQSAIYQEYQADYPPVIGNPFIAPQMTVTGFEHGWPYSFLARAVVRGTTPPLRAPSTPLLRFPSKFRSSSGPMYYDVSWSNFDHWPLTGDGWLFRPWHFLINLATVMLLIAGIGAFTQWRVGQMGGVVRFRLFDIFIGVAVCAVILGFFTYHIQLQQREWAGSPLPPLQDFILFSGELPGSRRYTGPVWLRKLAGNPYLLPMLYHVDSVTIAPSDRGEEAYQHLPQLPYLTRIHVRTGLPLTALPYLEQCPKLENLVLPSFDGKVPIMNMGQGGAWLMRHDLDMLQPLGLTQLAISGDQMKSQHIEQVAAFPTLKKLNLGYVWATAEEVEEIQARYPHVEINFKGSLRSSLDP